MRTRTKPTLRGERVVLRPIRAGDAEDMFRFVQEPEGRRLTGTHEAFEFEQIEKWCARLATAEGRVDLAITHPETGEFLGEVVLNDIDEVNLRANFRIALAGPGLFGRGYGTESARLMLRYGFHELGLHRIELSVYAFNSRAVHAYERLGFRREGVRCEVLFLEGEFHDFIEMGLLAREYSG